MDNRFSVTFMQEALDFLMSIDSKASQKVVYNIHKSQIIVDSELFKKLTDTIWEFRTLYEKTYYRLFAFWDKSDNTNTLVICSHGIIKKTKETPIKEIEKAENARKKYFELIEKDNGK